jgi:O-antigen ligase
VVSKHSENMVLISEKSGFKVSHLAWICMFASILIWSGISGSVEKSSLGNTGNWYRITLVLISGMLAAWALLRNGSASFVNTPISIWLLCIYGFIALTSSQFIPEHAFYVMWKSTEIIIDVFIIISILGEGKSIDALWKAYQILLGLFTILLILAWVGAFISPSKAFIASRGVIPYTISGVYPVQNGNTLAFTSAVVAYTQVCKIFRINKISFARLLLITVALFTLVLAQSRTSIVGFIVAIIAFLYFDKQKIMLLWLLIAIFVLGLFTGVATLFSDYFIRSQSTELFYSLSGRTRAWDEAMKLFFESPIIGNGFAAAARLKVLGVSGASTLHGAIFDVLVGVGLIGFIPWFFSLILGAKRLFRAASVRNSWMQSVKGRSVHAEMIGLFLLVITRSLTSSGISMHESTFMLLLVILAYAGLLPSIFSKKQALAK